MLDFDLTLWIPGSTSLLFVLGLGAYVVVRGFRLRAARQQIQHRILVTGTRGKSSTVRLIHEALSSLGLRSYGKVTGTTAVELGVGGRQHDTSRWGTIGVSEMVDAMHRARLQKADYGVFECMAVSLPLIEIVQRDMVRADIVIIPTIRLDHLEEEGHSELEIAMNILKAVRQPKVVITAISQDDLIAAYHRRLFSGDSILETRMAQLWANWENALASIHTAQVLTYLRFSGARLGYLINFNTVMLRNGLRRLGPMHDGGALVAPDGQRQRVADLLHQERNPLARQLHRVQPRQAGQPQLQRGLALAVDGRQEAAQPAVHRAAAGVGQHLRQGAARLAVDQQVRRLRHQVRQAHLDRLPPYRAPEN